MVLRCISKWDCYPIVGLIKQMETVGINGLEKQVLELSSIPLLFWLIYTTFYLIIR